MSEEKLDLAKSSILSLIESLDDTHSISLVNFHSGYQIQLSSNPSANTTESGEDFGHENGTFAVNSDYGIDPSYSKIEIAMPCGNETYAAIENYFKNHVTNTEGAIANVTRGIEGAISVDEKAWASGKIPENALSMIILLTDGRSATGNRSEAVGQEIRMLNKATKIPIFSIGVGFDANMEFLEDVSGTSYSNAVMFHQNVKIYYCVDLL